MSVRERIRHGGTPNRGPRRDARRAGTGNATYVMSGPLARIEREAGVLVLRVDAGNRRARRLLGRTLTVDADGARVSAPDRDADGAVTVSDLLPGERVTVRALLPRRPERLPDLIPARVVSTHEWT
jgi:hypothetical protein